MKLPDLVSDVHLRLRIVSATLAAFTDLTAYLHQHLYVFLFVKNGECGNGLLLIVSFTASSDWRGLSVSLFPLRLLE